MSKVSKKKTNKKQKLNLKKYITKQNIIYLIIAISDIFLIIYSARRNMINYVKIENKKMYLGAKTNLIFGRNYISLVTTLVVHIYTLLINKVYFKKKINIKNYIIFLILLLLSNCLIFYIFTNRVY
jgi:magnesium-transporting ATPase (P-type)